MEIEKLSTKLIYPEYDFHIRKIKRGNKITIHMEIQTYIRKLHDGIWYLIPVRLQNEFMNSSSAAILDGTISILKQFINESYRALLLYIIDPKTFFPLPFPHPAIYIDENQKNEADRIKNTF